MEYLDTIPQTLYKYRQWDNLFHQRILTEHEIFLSSASMFNDPFDASLPFRYRSEDLTPENIYKKLKIVGRKNWPDLSEEDLEQLVYDRQKSGEFETGDYWKSQHENFKEQIYKTFGILSLTTKYDNLLMWSHYANSHQGFCVGLDSKILFNVIGGSIGPVIYSPHFPEIEIFDETVGAVIRMLTTKSEHWQYEDEIRIIKHGAANVKFTFPAETITEIVLGCNMKLDHKKQIIEIIDKKMSHVKLKNATVDLDDFKLNVNTITLI